jgi:hypothetical protein
MAQEIIDLFSVLVTPGEVAGRVSNKPRFMVAVFTLLFLTALISIASEPFLQRFQENMSSRSGVHESRGSSPMLAPLSAIASTVMRWMLLTTGIFLAMVIASVRSASFKLIFAQVVYAEVILTIMNLVNVVILHVGGVDRIDTVADLQPLPGLDVLLANRAGDVPLFIVLNSINLFSVWYLAVLSNGVAVATGGGRRTAAIVVAGLWLSGVLMFAAAVAVAMRLSGGFAA